MDEHIPLLLTISFFFLLATLPQSHCQQDDTTKYSDCSRPYSCGVVSNIYYPFWGHNRPHYCGSSEQLELKCEESQVTSFQYGSQSFTVLNINTSANTMRMVRTDLANDACSSDLTNTSLSPPLFVYPQTVYNITIFYDCPLRLTHFRNNFTCQNDRNQLAFYAEEEELNSEFIGYMECERCIEVQALREIPLDSGGGIDALRRALAGGFEVKYNIADDGECRRCKQSKGACGVNTTANHQFSCHCPDGSDALQCYGHSANHSNCSTLNGGKCGNSSALSPSPTPALLAPSPSLSNISDQFHRATNCSTLNGGKCGNSSALSPSPTPALLAPSPSLSNVSDQFHRATSNKWNTKKKVIIGVTGSATITGLLICFTIFCLCKSSTWQGEFWSTTKSNQHIEAFLKNHGAQTLKRYKFSDVKKMTNSFKVKLGQGGFGAVYKGKLLNGCPVAVKILNPSKGNGAEFINEVASISRTSHVNVVTLLGFCLEGRKKALIYEFMSNGSLDKFIYQKGPENTPSLSWDNLYQIAIGIARGLEYLHRGCNTRILHFDIKPHNILLDEGFCPKISDFGLAKLCPRKESTISMSDARGTLGYKAPEVWNRNLGGVSHKSDVYSYGMMLLEMVGGRKNTIAEASNTSEIYYPHWVYNRLQQGNDLRPDGVLATEENEIAKRMTLVGIWCIQTFPNDRPTMSRVIDMLEGSMNFLKMPPKPILSSPTRSVPESSTT